WQGGEKLYRLAEDLEVALIEEGEGEVEAVWYTGKPLPQWAPRPPHWRPVWGEVLAGSHRAWGSPGGAAVHSPPGEAEGRLVSVDDVERLLWASEGRLVAPPQGLDPGVAYHLASAGGASGVVLARRVPALNPTSLEGPPAVAARLGVWRSCEPARIRVDSDLSWDARYPVVIAAPPGEAGLVVVAPISEYTFGGGASAPLAAGLQAYLAGSSSGWGVVLAGVSRVTGSWLAGASRLVRWGAEALLLEAGARRGELIIVPPTPPYGWGVAARVYAAALIASRMFGVRVEVGGLCPSWDKYLLEARGIPVTCLLFHQSQWRLAAAVAAAASTHVRLPLEPLAYRMVSELVALRVAEGRLEDAHRAGYLVPITIGIKPITHPPKPLTLSEGSKVRAAVIPAPHWAPRARRSPDALVEAARASGEVLGLGEEGLAVRGLLLSLLWRGYTLKQATSIALALSPPVSVEGSVRVLEVLGALEG
ncbi:MAG: hypothetical protein F7B17_06855, partial [Desulfurococcales archaeon]|nr:hypothetical protein [Desulfurococcales archaeon]